MNRFTYRVAHHNGVGWIARIYDRGKFITRLDGFDGQIEAENEAESFCNGLAEKAANRERFKGNSR